MKVEITEKGVYDTKGKAIAVGEVLDIDNTSLPKWLAGKARQIRDAAVAVTNPAEGGAVVTELDAATRQAILKAAAIQIGAEGFNGDGKPDVRSINRELAEGVVEFTAEERDTLWPGIAADVTAEVTSSSEQG